MPFGFTLKAYTQAVGYVADDCFRGTMQLDYDLHIIGLNPALRPMIEAQLGKFPERAKFSGTGSFEVKLN